jgi:uroporphyrinogen decarboxylase
MRQAGRYLPEYRELRQKATDFLSFCFSPELAAEATLQPLRRFDLDAAILFSDILVVPHALGQAVRFEPGEGPVLDPVSAETMSRLDVERAVERLSPVFETIRRVREDLPADKALIGFCGAPWTVATYMIGGRGSPDQAAARLFALQQPIAFRYLLDVLVQASIGYLVAQLRAGADSVQLFESWAQNLDEPQFADYVIAPAQRIIAGVRSELPDAVIIGFPRGAGALLATYGEAVGVSAIGLDHMQPPAFVNSVLPSWLPVQGNLDPMLLVAGGEAMDRRARTIIEAFAGRPHIFNLGHGITPETPIEHVARLIEVVKGRG